MHHLKNDYTSLDVLPVWINMLTEIDYDIDMKMIRKESRDMEGYAPFVDPKTGRVVDEWLIKRVSTGYARVVSDHFEKILNVEVKPRFYIQEKGFTLPFHQDRGTQCCINFVLSTSKDPIVFRKDHNTYTYQYKQALMNVQEEHMVKASREDRYLFKLSIFDMCYDEALKAIMKSY